MINECIFSEYNFLFQLHAEIALFFTLFLSFLQVISGQQFPKPKGSTAKGDVSTLSCVADELTFLRSKRLVAVSQTGRGFCSQKKIRRKFSQGKKALQTLRKM